MDIQFSPVWLLLPLLILLPAVMFRRLGSWVIPPPAAAKQDKRHDHHRDATKFYNHKHSPEATAIAETLSRTLPDCTVLPADSGFDKLTNAYWARQEWEAVPSCVVRPRNVDELCKVVLHLKQCFDGVRSSTGERETLFAVRSGGHSPVSGAASINGGVLIDLSRFSSVTVSEDNNSVTIGTGARWLDVYQVLDQKGLAVVGGRNSVVGVGGLTLGGGLSFFSSRFGMVCSNVIQYEVVLASGSVVTASAEHNSDLWRALKGGGNNFGIVTRLTARTFPTSNIWSGFLYLPSFQVPKVLCAFHQVTSGSDESTGVYDQFAAGPIACFSYIHQIGMQIVSVNLVYTKPPDYGEKWPTHWKKSPFAGLWRLWSTCKTRTLSDATDEMANLNPPGRRQNFATTTIKNDLATLHATHAAYQDAITKLRKHKIKGLIYTLVLQPLLPVWARKGDPNPLGLDTGDEPLVIVSFTVNWDESQNDDFMKNAVRSTIEAIQAAARANNTAHPYEYANYCAEWQNPYESYGAENLSFLRSTSTRYDPDGLFQTGCAGGFKLGMGDEKVLPPTYKA